MMLSLLSKSSRRCMPLVQSMAVKSTAPHMVLSRSFSLASADKRVLVVGAGRVGRSIAHMLSREEGYGVRIGDAKVSHAERVARELGDNVEAVNAQLVSKDALRGAMNGVQAVISAAPFAVNKTIADVAAESGVHYMDLTEDVEVTKYVQKLSQKDGVECAFVPQCGVAPGFVGIAGKHVMSEFDEVDTLTLRVGALPDQPNNRLKYNLTWSTEGLVNEYIQPCEALRDGKVTMIPPLIAKEEVVIDGVNYEAFSTSGGCGSLPHVYAGKVKRLDYKTLRYPGHLYLIQFLMEDLGFKDKPDELVKIFTNSIPATKDDIVIVSVRGTGRAKGSDRLIENTFWRKIPGRFIGDHFFTGIEVATSAGVCGVAHELLSGNLPQQGFIGVEQVSFSGFMNSPFGKYYARQFGARHHIDNQ